MTELDSNPLAYSLTLFSFNEVILLFMNMSSGYNPEFKKKRSYAHKYLCCNILS